MTEFACRRCGRGWPRTSEFFPSYRRAGVKKLLGTCRECERARQRQLREENPEAVRARKERWRQRNPGAEAEHQKRYNDSEKGKASKRRYAQTEKGQAATRRYRRTKKGRRMLQRARRNGLKRRQALRERERMELEAAIPGPVLLPFIQEMLHDVRVSVGAPPENFRGKYWGIGVLEARTGVSARLLALILDGKKRSVTLEICDRLQLQSDFTLGELTDRAREWALLTGDPWPRGYTGQSRKYFKIRGTSHEKHPA